MNNYNEVCKTTEEFLESFFFSNYLPGLNAFLCSVYDNFKFKFGDLKLNSIQDQLLFEDFIQFISTYFFRNNEAVYMNIRN